MAAALLRRLTAPDADADLLRRFAESRDEAAFAELVRRHGPAVYRVCRRLVGPHADDAFQATFLILATRARAVREPGAVGGWLIGVAGRVARQMRKAEGRHARWRAGGVSPLLERPGGWPQQGANAPRSPETADLARVLDEELTRLPDRLRGPAVLCLVEGRTQEQAAADLGGSVRTVRRRLDEARALLRLRLERRGVVPAVAAALVAGAGDGLATVSASLVQATVGVAFDFLAGGARTAPAAVIAKGVTMTLFARKLAAGLVAAAVGLVGLGVGFADDGAKPVPAGTTIPPQNLPATPPVKAFDPPPASPASHFVQTPNFLVTGPTPEVSQKIADEAERHRTRLAKEWLGKQLPMWPKPCRVTVEVKPDHSGGASTFTFDKDKVQTLEMKLFGPLPQLVGSTVPHEVMHCVLATHFGRALPRWADEGLAVLAESAEEQHAHDVRCRELLNQGRCIQLKNLLGMTEYPRDMVVLFAQGYSVCRFLLDRHHGPFAVPNTVKVPDTSEERERFGARTTLLDFVRRGLAVGWAEAVKTVYGFDSVDDLEVAWLQWLQKSPTKRLAPPKPTPPTVLLSFQDHWTVGVPEVKHTAGRVTASAKTAAVARAVANEFALLHRQYCRTWLGTEPTTDGPPIVVKLAPAGATGYAYYLNAELRTPGQPLKLIDGVSVNGLEEALDSTLKPGALVAAVLDPVRKPVPPWLVAGLAGLEAPLQTRGLADRACRLCVSRGQAIPLTYTLTLPDDDPRGRANSSDTLAVFAQGFSVVRFLVARDGERSFARFVAAGAGGRWAEAAKDVYGFESIDRLQAAWLDWLRSPASRAGLPEPTGDIPRELDSEFVPRIPATQVDADRIGRIIIEGNTVTAERVILKQLGFAPGQPLSYPQLEKARTNLLKLGIFDSEDPPTVEVIPGEAGTGFKDIRVRVKETKTGVFMIGPLGNTQPGVSSADGNR